MKFYYIILLELCLANQFLDIQLVPDCDEEFGATAMSLLRSHIPDLVRLERINAILSSCNKAMIQKLTEVSIFLMQKDGFDAKLFESLTKLSHAALEQKARQLQQKTYQAPDSVRHIMNQIVSINLNKSLSGNEKISWITTSLIDLQPEQKKTIQRLLNQDILISTTPSPIKPIIRPSFPIKANSSEEEDLGKPSAIHPDVPPSFEIKKDTDAAEIVFATATRIPPRNENTSEMPTKKDSPLYGVSNQHMILPTLYNKNDPGSRYIDLMTKNSKNVEESATSHMGNFGTPIQPIVHSQGRPLTVGTSIQSKTVETELLKARNMLWRDAVDFLDRTDGIPDVLKKLIHTSFVPNGVPAESQPMNNQSPSNTFPLPSAAYEQIRKLRESDQEAANQNAFLPSSDDPGSIVPVNTYKSLDRFDTQVGRFDNSGPSNRIVLSASPAQHIPALPMQGMEINQEQTISNKHLLPTIAPQTPTDQMKTYPNYREGLFPLHENHARPTSPQSRTIIPREGGEVHADINDQVNGKGKGMIITDPAQYANGGTVVLENFPGQPYSTQPKPKQTIGDDLSESDPIGSLPMGRSDKEFPRYPPPPPLVLPTTTVISIIQPTRHTESTGGIDRRFPYFPNIDTPMNTIPDFRPYRGPEEITGSHIMLREIYNVKHHGQNKFVKIDLLNE